MSKNKMKEHLDRELTHITFTQQDVVLAKIQSKKINKWRYFWDKEVEISLVPATAIFILLFGLGFYTWSPTHLTQVELEPEKKLIEIAGNVYWDTLIKREVEE